MAAWTTVALVAATVAAVGSTAYSAYASAEAADEQAELQNKQAQMEEEAAATEAEAIREKAKRLRAGQIAALAASGVKLDDSTTSGAILDETDRLSEQDALAVMREGSNRAALLRGQADIARGTATATRISGALNTAATVASGISSYQRATASSRAATQLNMDSSAQQFVTRTQPRYSLLNGNYRLGGSGL